MREVIVKSVLNKKKKRDTWFLDDYTLNPFEGCSFNCQYCYIRGSKYGINMEEGLAIKINGPDVLDRQLAFRVKKEQYGMIALASGTDPYLRIEEKYRITRRYLELILQHRFPVLIITKSKGILRDLDLLVKIRDQAIHAPDLRGRLQGAIASFSLSSLDVKISDTLEPGAPPPLERLDTMQRCKRAGLTVGLNLMPLLPFISDTYSQMDEMVGAAKAYGADYVLLGSLTLFGENPADSKSLYYKFLERTDHELLAQYRKLYRIFFAPPPAYQDEFNRRAEEICAKHQVRRSILSPS